MFGYITTVITLVSRVTNVVQTQEERGDKNPAVICFGKYKIYQALQTRAFGVECKLTFAPN